MSEENTKQCVGGPRLIFACSGAADVGEIADRAARKMTGDGIARMFCMAGIGPRIEGITKTAQVASTILAIDGCDVDCVRKGLDQAGFGGFKHLRVTDLGMKKGSARPTEENISKVAHKGGEMLS